MGDVIEHLLHGKPDLNTLRVTEKYLMENNKDILWDKSDDMKHRSVVRAAPSVLVLHLLSLIHARHGHRGIAATLPYPVRRVTYFRPAMTQELREYMLFG